MCGGNDHGVACILELHLNAHLKGETAIASTAYVRQSVPLHHGFRFAGLMALHHQEHASGSNQGVNLTVQNGMPCYQSVSPPRYSQPQPWQQGTAASAPETLAGLQAGTSPETGL